MSVVAKSNHLQRVKVNTQHILAKDLVTCANVKKLFSSVDLNGNSDFFFFKKKTYEWLHPNRE